MLIKINGETKANAFATISDYLASEGLSYALADDTRPWGGFFVIEEKHTDKFFSLFFPAMDASALKQENKLSPKILVVEKHKRLSWQYHYRRSEIWTCIGGPVGVARSFTDEEGSTHVLHCGDTIELQQGERHRLIGMDDWGVVAEIWKHTDMLQPSNENDIVRLQDDFGR
ncbi:MAG TPA: hypothetical protein VF487_16120 [Chitinophagaceae bacterium]